MTTSAPVPIARRMTLRLSCWLPVLAAAFAAGCAIAPTGPSVLVLPGSSRSFDQFQLDQAACRHYASVQIGGADAQRAADDVTARSAALGTAIGALAGAAVGGSEGAGLGAGAGLLFGAAAGTDRAADAGWGSQQRYDQAFVQCMYAAGHRVPVSGRFSQPGRIDRVDPSSPYAPPPPASSARSSSSARSVAPVGTPPPAGYAPPPPPPAGSPPPPPPGIRAR